MIPKHDLSVRSGNGWTIVETGRIQETPGAHDVGEALGIAQGSIVLVVLRAAEHWAPNNKATTEGCTILRREGQMFVELSDGSTQPLDEEREWATTADRYLEGVVNVGLGLAKALVIARQAAGPAVRGR